MSTILALRASIHILFLARQRLTDKEEGRLLATIRTRIVRLLCRRGLIGEDTDPTAVDPLEAASIADSTF